MSAVVVACLPCRKTKKRCEPVPNPSSSSSLQPSSCQRCLTHGLPCQYPSVPRQPRTKLSVIKRKLDRIESLVKGLKLGEMGRDLMEEMVAMRSNNRVSLGDLGQSRLKLNSNSGGVHLDRMMVMKRSREKDFYGLNHSMKLINMMRFKSQLLALYQEKIHPALAFIDLRRVKEEIDFDTTTTNQQEEVDSPLLLAIYCRSYRFLQQSKTPGQVPPLEEDYFYRLYNQKIKHNFEAATLNSIQGELLISLEELGQNYIELASRRVNTAITKSHIFGLNDPTSLRNQLEDEEELFSTTTKMMGTDKYNDELLVKRMDLRYEKLSTWIACIYIDTFATLFNPNPTLSRFSEFDMSEEISYLKKVELESQQYKRRFSQESGYFSCSFGNGNHANLSTPPGSLGSASSPWDFSSDHTAQSSSSPSIQEGVPWEGRTQIHTLALLPRLSSLMKKTIVIKKRLEHEEEEESEASLFQAQNELFELSVTAYNLLPPDINVSALTLATLEDDPSLMMKFICYLSCHCIRMEAGASIQKIGIVLAKKYSCPYEAFGRFLNLPSVNSGSYRFEGNNNPQVSKTIKMFFTQGDSLKCLGGDAIVKGFSHIKPDYWVQYAPATIMLTTPIVLILLCSALDPSPVVQSLYSWAKSNVDKYLAPWPLLGTKILVEGKRRCNFACQPEVQVHI